MRIEGLHGLMDSGASVVGQDGSKIGKMGQVFLDDQTSEPEWVTVKTGMFGTAESFIPLTSATITGDELQVAFDKDTVKDAPRVDDSEGHLSQDEEAKLYSYYGMDYSGTETETVTQPDVGLATGQVAGDTTGVQGREASADFVGTDTSALTTDSSMTRSEERLDVGTEKVSSGKVRLRKYIVTENVTQTVPVSREEVRLEREPINEGDRGDMTVVGELTEDVQEVELSEERVVVDKETVPVERVKLDKETVTEQEQVSEEVRKEQIETDHADRGLDTSGPAGEQR